MFDLGRWPCLSLPVIVAVVPLCAQSVEGNVHLDFVEVPIYGEVGELIGSDLVYQEATADLQINVPVVQAISVRDSALGEPAFWGDTSTWDNPTLALGRAFPITYTVVNPIFGKPVSPTGVVEAVEALTNGGPTEMTVEIPVKIAVVELPGLKLDFNPGAELKWNVNLPLSASVIMNQVAKIENLTIASGAGLTGNANMIVREDVFNGGLITGTAGLVEGDFINYGVDSAGDRTVLTGDVLTVGGVFSNQSGAGVYGHGRIEGAINNAGGIIANTGDLTLLSNSLTGKGSLGAEPGGTLILQNTANSIFRIGQEVALSGGTLKTSRGFTTSGSGVVRGYGQINSDVAGRVIAEYGVLRVRESDSFESGALLEAASGGTLEWLSAAAADGNRTGSTIRALDGGTVRLVTPDRFTQAGLTSFTNDGVIEVMEGGTLAVAEGPTNIFLEGDGHIRVHQGGLLTTESNVWFNQLIDNEGVLNFGDGTRLRGGLSGDGFVVQSDRSVYLDMADDSAFDVSNTITLSGGTLVADHGFTTAGVPGAAVVRGFGRINGDIGGRVIAEGGTLEVRENDRFEPGAVLEAALGGTLLWQAVSNSSANGNRPGAVMRARDGGEVVVQPFESFFNNYYDFTNEGTIEVMDGGKLSILERGIIEGAGDIAIQDGGVLYLGSRSQIRGATLSGGGEFNVTGGTLRDVNISEGTVISNANLAGSLAVDGVVSSSGYRVLSSSSLSGNGEITADVINNGLVAPGSATGSLKINGDYTHGGGAELQIKIGGTVSGEFDVLRVLGDVNIQGGILRVVFTKAAFEVPVGTQYDILIASSIIGSFDSMVLPTDEAGVELLSVDLDQPGTVRITALSDFQVVPEPTSIMIFSIASALLARCRRMA